MITLQSPAGTGKTRGVRRRECPPVLRPAAFSLRVPRGVGPEGFFIKTMGRKQTPQGTNNWAIRWAIERGLRYEDGKVILPSGKIAKARMGHRGYQLICLGVWNDRKTFAVARVVCWLVHGPPPFESAQVDHIDRDKSNDSPENLRWVSASENMKNMCPLEKQRRAARLEAIRLRGEEVPNSKLTKEQALEIRFSSVSCRKLARKFGIHTSIAQGIRNGLRWKHLPLKQ